MDLTTEEVTLLGWKKLAETLIQNLESNYEDYCEAYHTDSIPLSNIKDLHEFYLKKIFDVANFRAFMEKRRGDEG